MLALRVFVVLLFLQGVFCAPKLQAQTYRLLYTFTGGADGSGPWGRLVRDSNGNLYGSTLTGGNLSCGSTGCGLLFKLDPTGKRIVLHTFNGKDGNVPTGSMARDQSMNLYGTTYIGGRLQCNGFSGHGCGVVFKMSRKGGETVLYRFSGGADGDDANELIRHGAGNVYGTTYGGGKNGYGTIFKVGPSGNHTVLRSFAGGLDGGYPQAGLVRDVGGNLYGKANLGLPGCFEGIGCGLVFKLDRAGKFTVLHRFTGGSDGGVGFYSFGGLVKDSAGNLYGTTEYGGDLACPLNTGGCGVVFKVDRTGKETVLHAFNGAADGAFPLYGLVRDTAGNLYGTTDFGGPTGGTIFKLDTAGKLTTLYAFTGTSSTTSPNELVGDAHGNLYGVANGTHDTDHRFIYEIIP